MDIRKRIQRLLTAINQGVYEKDTELGLSLLAALAGESVLLLGPPGVAKSMVARRLKAAFKEAKAFEYLMSRFSTPDEIFGPISINRLKEFDKYERAVEGYLPTASVVFLDEIWKAGPAIQNSLLTAINEKIYRNGDSEIRLPLKLLIAASNELPAHGEGLEALWDRFLLRIICTCVQDEDTFHSMLLDDSDKEINVPTDLQISEEEYAEWRKQIGQVSVPTGILQYISNVRRQLKRLPLDDEDTARNIYVSDRRWKNIVQLLKASAFINGRPEVNPADLLPLYHCLWNEADECEPIHQLVLRELFTSCLEEMEEITESIKADIRISRVRQALEDFKNNTSPKNNLQLTDYFYYHVEEHGTGHTYIFAVDYLALKEQKRENSPRQALIYPDPLNPERSIIRCYPGTGPSSVPQQRVNLYREGTEFLLIDGVRYPMTQKKKEAGNLLPAPKSTSSSNKEPQIFDNVPRINTRDYRNELNRLSQRLLDLTATLCTDNIFTHQADKELVSRFSDEVRKKLRNVEIEEEKLQFNLQQYGGTDQKEV
ncbi:AAA family ATPase [Bacteroides stercorirosoris]|uniref:AAA family ATPase n=1 Tax=Bacteroides stercorirosoris TaxID=871324 RepID=UPI0023F9957B|nr:AAA family ATPase [Bacteroides stercorirosoris]